MLATTTRRTFALGGLRRVREISLFSLSSSRRRVFAALGKRSHRKSPGGKNFRSPMVSLSPLVKESEREFRALRRSQFTMFLFDLSLSLSLPYFPTPLCVCFSSYSPKFSLFFSLSWGKYPYTKQASASVQEQRRLFSADAVQSTDESSWDTAIAQGATEETKRELASLAKTMADIKDAVQRETPTARRMWISQSSSNS